MEIIAGSLYFVSNAFFEKVKDLYLCGTGMKYDIIDIAEKKNK